MGRYVPKHRKRRQAAARRAMAHAGALFVGGAVLLSGAYGSGPVLVNAAPLAVSPDDAPVDDDPGFPSVPAPTPSSTVTSPTEIRTSSADPAFVDIAAIGATSTIGPLGTLLDGRLETPNDFMKVGWWAGGVVPGAVGPAVLAGHLDSVQGPAIFARLHQLKPDDRITIARRDGVVLHFAVTRIDRYPKDLFPATQVYGATSTRELRLITCGGQFDRQARSYTANTVVYATLVEDDLDLVEA